MATNLLDNKDKFGALLILAFALFYLRYIFDIQVDPAAGNEFFTPRTLPFGLAVLTILLSIVQLCMPVSATVGSDDQASIRASVESFQWRPAILLILLMLVYSLLFKFLGFVIATFLFLASGFFILGERRALVVGMVAGGLVAFMWLLLTQLFNLYLDSGTLMAYLVGAA